MKIEILKVGQLKTNCYLVYEEGERSCFIIDPGDDAYFIIRRIKDLDLKPKAILATHGHFDHVLGALELQLGFNIPFYIHKKDAPLLKRAAKTSNYFLNTEMTPVSKADKFFKKDQVLKLSNINFKVLETPGHTQGGVSFYAKKEKVVFVGDLIFEGGDYGRTDLKGGDFNKLQTSIKKIFSLPGETIIYPGHGNPTTISQEKEFWQTCQEKDTLL
jgi:hydroxyacylglutathione hydrolase